MIDENGEPQNKIEVHELGFVKLLDVMGNDEEVENAARLSYGTGTRKVSQTRNLIRYLMRHKHTSPFEMSLLFILILFLLLNNKFLILIFNFFETISYSVDLNNI